MKALIAYLLSLMLLVFIAGCSENFFMSGRYEATSAENRVITLNGQTDFSMEDTNGEIDILSSDTAKSIYCNIFKKVKSKKDTEDARLHLKSIVINTTRSSDGVKIKVNHPRNDNRNYNINFEIVMPDNFNYDLSLGNGNVSVDASTRNLSVNVGNGKADADVVLNGKCDVSLSVGNGSISLKIPDKTNASVDATVGNGNVSSNGLEFDNMEKSSRTLSGTLGSGAGKIDLSVGNGSINLRKK